MTMDVEKGAAAASSSDEEEEGGAGDGQVMTPLYFGTGQRSSIICFIYTLSSTVFSCFLRLRFPSPRG